MTLRPDLDDLADELVADDQRRLDRRSPPTDPTHSMWRSVPQIPVLLDPDEDVVDADRRARGPPRAPARVRAPIFTRASMVAIGRPSRSASRRPDSPPRRSPRSRSGRDRRARGRPAGRGRRPTPAGVPVEMMSPGSRVIEALMYSISVGMSKTMSAGAAVLHQDRGAGVGPAAGDPPGADRQVGRAVELVGGHEHGADREERVGALGPQPLAVAVLAGPSAGLTPCQSRAETSLTTT